MKEPYTVPENYADWTEADHVRDYANSLWRMQIASNMDRAKAMNPASFVLATGLLINSAIYFVLVFVAALLLNRHLAMVVVLIAVGVTYLSYYAQLANILLQHRLVLWLSGLLVLASIVLGALAGLMLV